MVVIPTSTHVSLYYGRTPVDLLGILMTIAGIGLAVRWARRGPVVVDDPERPDPLLPGHDEPDADPSDPDSHGLHGPGPPDDTPSVQQPVRVSDRGS
jgi:hypothetical protein